MLARIFSTFALWAAIILVLVFGKIWGALALLILFTGAAHWELCTLLMKCGANPRREMSVITGVMLVAGICYSVLFPTGESPLAARDWLIAVPGLIVCVVMLCLLKNTKKLVDWFCLMPSALSWLYIPFCMLPLAFLAAQIWMSGTGGNLSGMLLVVWFIATVKFTDCGALIFGLTFGKHKLAPSISPGKSWEGVIGGVATSAGVAAGVAWLYSNFHDKIGWTLSAQLTPGKAALLALPLAALSVPSDLVESVFKRRAGVKDSGKTIPGIGGAFDLLDSLILTAPVGYLLIKFFVIRN